MNGKGRGGKYLERENIFSAEEDKRWKGEKYLVKENIFLQRKTRKGKVKNIWRRNIEQCAFSNVRKQKAEFCKK